MPRSEALAFRAQPGSKAPASRSLPNTDGSSFRALPGSTAPASGACLVRQAPASGTAGSTAPASLAMPVRQRQLRGLCLFQKRQLPDIASFPGARFKAPGELRARKHSSKMQRFALLRVRGGCGFCRIRGERGFDMARVPSRQCPISFRRISRRHRASINLEVGRELPELEEIEDEERGKLGRRGRWHRRGLKKIPRYRRVFEAIGKTAISGTSRRAGGR